MGSKPVLVDLFCGAGGATRGYQLAGFTVIGIDIAPQPRYCGDYFIQMNAMEVDLASFGAAAVHASPPCQKYSAATRHLANDKPKLIDPLRSMLKGATVPYVIENTPGAPLIDPITLCGLSFGLNVKRHRLFESNVLITGVDCIPDHPGDWYVIFGHEVRSRRHGHAAGRKNHVAEGRAAMGIPWMTRGELSEAIPPAYTAWIGCQLMAQLG